jgi:hypothetical protein
MGLPNVRQREQSAWVINASDFQTAWRSRMTPNCRLALRMTIVKLQRTAESAFFT